MTDMSKQLEFISIVPQEEVTIVGPFDEDRETFIAIHNPIKQLIAFKLKSSSGISVKPRFGYIRSKGETFVKVKAAAGAEGETPSTQEFIKVTLCCAPKNHPAKPREFWKKMKKVPTFSRKLRVAFTAETSINTDSGNSLSDVSEESSPSSASTGNKKRPTPKGSNKRKAPRKGDDQSIPKCLLH